MRYNSPKSELGKFIPIVIIGAPIAFGVTLAGKWLGFPRVWWASDVCPASNVSCGVMPVGLVVGALVAGVVVSVLLGWVSQR